MRRVELARQAVRDLRKLPREECSRVEAALREGLTADPPPENLDVKALQGRAGWFRLRVGDWRVVYRPLTRSELERLGAAEVEGYLVARVVNRRDLERALRTLAL